MKRVLYSVLLCLSPLIMRAEVPVLPGTVETTVEKKKTIIKLFDVDSKDNLVVDNQFGQVTIGLWDRPEIKIQITIIANSDSDERTQKYLDAVSIEEKRSGNQITVRTNFSQSAVSNWSFGKWKDDGERNFVRINYDVMMPKQNALTLKNRFGNTSIHSFQAPLTVYTRYGNFIAEELASRQNDIDVAYGKANIRYIDAGKLDMAYGSLELVKANDLTLTNKAGKMTIGDVGKLNADINYSGAKIGNLRESGKIKLSFSGGFRIDQLPKTVENVDIQASYSSVALPVDRNNDCDFDVTVSYGSFNYPSNSTWHFTAQPDDDNRRGPKLTKQYVGKVGSGSGTKVRVVSKFGNVNFQ
ncbi:MULTISPECIES: hypothetical protein [unclassified Spirosoma]|uniref:hypothetical protein n=1 Tax=unclassified Spirosoma TaxID=2621999 RepID=UPI00095F2997|nr:MULTISPECIES: hypothetical protein [unclassified Spirosoma]MBN8825015.1 hypothetical protein [Spirosoma sp.]OJW73308.1 MAG: hypothetical protein BGO59_07475 [Spirosoma sp. 48-14]